MKVILTGATGFVGGELLKQLLAHPQIEQVTAITRRPLSRVHEKLKPVLQSDFTRYAPEQLEALRDHEACLWALGGKATDFPSLDGNAQVTHSFTLALAEALVLARRGEPFRFC